MVNLIIQVLNSMMGRAEKTDSRMCSGLKTEEVYTVERPGYLWREEAVLDKAPKW